MIQSSFIDGFLKSFRKNSRGILLMLVSAIFTSIGQLFWKLSFGELNGFLILGFFCYGAGALLMIVALKFGSLSVIHPVLCSSYVFVIILGYCFLNESISLIKLVGILTVSAGVILIGGGDH